MQLLEGVRYYFTCALFYVVRYIVIVVTFDASIPAFLPLLRRYPTLRFVVVVLPC